ncbi:MAG: molybdopterin molybdotransferase MoeA, partial [Actinobacteria bacterium]|nr:molybdopterin molybdotransferase MoeA [Actinomycetota bacterium]
IMTGAMVPDGADGVVIVEHTELDGDEVVIRHPAGDHIRPAGGDVAPGDLVFPAGTELTSAHLGVLASLGLGTVPVRPRPRVGVLSTGDELVPPGEPLPRGKIRESNRPMLLAQVREAACEPVDLGTVADDETALEAALRDAVGRCDAVLTSGGVSMGEYDFVKVVLDRIADMRWFQIAIKPAKPLAFGVARLPGDGHGGGSVPVFGLPGNPVSSSVSCELFARPALRQMMGHADILRLVVTAQAAGDFPRHPDGKTHFDRVRAWFDDGRLMAERSGAQASNVLSALAHANGLAVLPDGDGVQAGGLLDVLLLRSTP